MNSILKLFPNLRQSNPLVRLGRAISSNTIGVNSHGKNNDGSTSTFNSTEEYIEDRVTNLFSIILADIHLQNQINSDKPNAIIYSDPFGSRDQILRDILLSKNDEILRDNTYSIQDLIEEEFQLEISDEEFKRFQSLKDIVKYVSRRWKIRDMQQLRDSYYEYWY